MKRKTIGCALLLSLLIPISLAAQTTGQITGVVTSNTGQPVAGVLVVVQGTQLKAVSGNDGRYTIANVPAAQYVLQASSLGYATVSVPVTVMAGSGVAINIQIEARAILLDSLVVVGYGTQRRETVTGSVATISKEQFVAGPARDAASLIAGKIAGLAIVNPTGNPTATSQIQLRGRTTIQGPTNPLILIDGVPGELQTVPAEDIESISVLKDGSAAAIYGTRGSNGVILITTKRHDGGSPTLRYDGYVSQSRLYKRPEFLTAGDYRRLISEGTLPAIYDLGNTTDWLGAVLREPASHRHNLTLSGGALNTNYTASLNYENTEGIFRRSDNQEVTARANIRHAMFDGKLEAEANLLNRTQTNFTGPGFNGIWRQALIRNPTDRIADDNGVWTEAPGSYMYFNPVGLLEEESGETEVRTQRLYGTLTLKPIEALRFSISGGTTRANRLTGSATTFEHQNNVVGRSGGTASRSTSSDVDRIVELTSTFSDQIADHNVTMLGGYAYQDALTESFSANNSRFPSDLFGWDALQRGSGLGDGIAGMSSDKSDYKLIGFFGRLNYDYKNRYLLMASVRHEGNSRFGADHKWGTFPAISAGWRIGEESFMDGVSFIDDLRLRVGYGVTGIAPDNSYLSLVSYSYGTRFFYNGAWVQGLGPARNPNPNLRWEEKSELNFGLNFSMLGSRLNGALDVYRRDTKDLLYNYAVPVPPYLSNSFLANVGDMRNNGIELELAYDVVSKPGLRWTTSANWSTNTNKLLRLSDEVFNAADCSDQGGTGEPIQTSTHRLCVGQPIGNFYGKKSVDITDTGEWIVIDSAGERIPISQSNNGDRHILGNGIPKQNFAWNNLAQIKNFDLSVNLRGAADFQVLNYLRMYYENPKIQQYNMLKSAYDPVYGKRPVNFDLSYVSYYVEDGDYIKLDNVTLGYTFGPGSLSRLSSVLSGARFYVSGRNLLTITGYKGLDPEVSTTGLSPGQESRDAYPTIRMFTAGMTFSF